ncbi:MAG: hypothetical protein ACI9F9_003044, partial [Candidatus Paceibacteria bacterium]
DAQWVDFSRSSEEGGARLMNYSAQYCFANPLLQARVNSRESAK